MLHSKQGFTLIELLVVISIIGLLASVVLVSLNGARQKARDAKRVADLKQISTALELYVNDNGTYPAGAYDSRNVGLWTTFSAFLNPYMKKVPVAPLNGQGDGLMCGNCDEYYYSGQTTKYVLSTFLAGTSIPNTGSNIYGPYYSIVNNCTSFDMYTCN